MHICVVFVLLILYVYDCTCVSLLCVVHCNASKEEWLISGRLNYSGKLSINQSMLAMCMYM